MNVSSQLLAVTLIASFCTVSACSKKTGELRTQSMASVAATSVPDDFDVSGTYRFEAIRTSAASAPFIGEIKNQLLLEGIATLQQNEDGSVVMERTVCHAELLSAKEAVRSTIDQAFLRQLYSDSRSGTLKVTDGLASLEFPNVYYVAGAELENPGEDALPEDPNDARVIDAEGDGKPGMTITVEGIASGEIYMVQRITSAWHSTAVSTTGIEGRIEWTEERGMLGATSGRLEQKRDSWVTEDPAENRFTMIPVESGTNCTPGTMEDDAHPMIMEGQEPPPEGARSPTTPPATPPTASESGTGEGTAE